MVSIIPTLVIGFTLSAVAVFPLYAASSELDEASDLLKKIHHDQCLRHTLRGQVMVAHREHDQKRLDELYPSLDSITRKLKPDEARLEVIKNNLSHTASDQDAYESLILELGGCD
ncbi:MAG: hypothetical protein ACR2HF_14845 [Methylococcaceae bacterium]